MTIVLKCKMCGGDIEVSQDMTVGICLYCGSTMTLPKVDNDKKARLFNRANQYRMECEFDKAYRVYEAILQEDEQEAEAYWGLILSEYGVEYVKDPKTGKRIPTCHRINIKSIRTSVHYESAIKYADIESRFMYEDEAKFLDDLQKKAISVSLKEEPYDVFICYKEIGEDGQRTQDSLLAENIYDELEKRNIRTFFARISLEDKIGQNYEPFIYSALNSAKVMLIVATKNEHCEAVWVKNEWSRYLRFMKDGDKTIIPVYKEMSPYEFPDELSKFQAQDMGKVGAIQDLTRGIQKLLGQTKKEKENEILSELVEEKFDREKKKARRAKLFKICAVLVVLITIASFIGFYVYKNVVVPKQIYEKAVAYMEKGEYESAIKYLEQLDMEDVEIKGYLETANYMIASKAADAKNEDKAIEYYIKSIDYKDSRERMLDLVYKKFRRQSRYETEKAAETLNIVVQYSIDYDKSIQECNYNKEMNILYKAAIERYISYKFEIAKEMLEPLAKLNYLDSKEYLDLIIDIREKSSEKLKQIEGKYKKEEAEHYIIFKDNNKIYYTQYEEEVNKNIITEGWTYEYIAELDKYIVFTSFETVFEVVLKFDEIQVNLLKGGTNYVLDRSIPGKYRLILD